MDEKLKIKISIAQSLSANGRTSQEEGLRTASKKLML
jgi:hypothetical protein